jgi:puromycin-sensitive aminopeptidase
MTEHDQSVDALAYNYRLARTVVPEHYELLLMPDLDKANFVGRVKIDVDVLESTQEIVLNSADLGIYEVSLTSQDGTSLPCIIRLDSKRERLHVKVNGSIGKGKWQIALAFRGILNDKLKGFYRSQYKDENGTQHVIACTQFEAADARRAFPCFDEPDFKATFKVSLIVEHSLGVVSNGLAIKQMPLNALEAKQYFPFQLHDMLVDNQALKLIEFATTMKMSTYLVAFVIGRLQKTEPICVNGVDITAWCVPGKEHLTKFALRSACFAICYFERYFGLPYPGGRKLDLLAIPDFASGAMENLACITFREARLLVDENKASAGELESIAEVVMHEIAHMWFGDLVTMHWWHGLWLNEAFATFMEFKCADAFMPNWQLWNRVACTERVPAMRVDALFATRPIEFEVREPEEADAMFDYITYEKGGGVLRMLEQYLGEDIFQKGIALYMARHAYDNTDTNDLWNALEESSGLSVRQIMNNWIMEPGFPLVTVAAEASSIHFHQTPFKYLSYGNIDSDSKSTIWQIPVMLCAKTAQGIVEKKFLLSEENASVYIGENIEWVIVNAGGHGFYRVLYDDSLLSKLTDNRVELSVIERTNIISDMWAGLLAGIRLGNFNDQVFLEMLKLFSDETDPNVWAQIFDALRTIKRTLPKSHRPAFEQYVCQLLRPLHEKLGWHTCNNESEPESVQMRELRASVIRGLAILGGDVQVQEKANSIYADKNAFQNLDGDVCTAILSIVAYRGSKAQYDEFAALAQAPDLPPQERQRYLRALSEFNDLELLQRTLVSCIDPNAIRTQDAPMVIARTMMNEVSRNVTWDFIKNNWQAIVSLYPPSRIVYMCEAVVELATPELESEVRAFFLENPIHGGDKAIAQTLELLQVAILFKQRYEESLMVQFSLSKSA